jgi:hypothetical protein
MDDSSLVPFQRQAISSGVYEREIEDLLWDNLEELTGENLFRVARQPTLPSLGRPDVLALDKQGRIVVIEVKRDVDRGQLAQALEYAGWARNVGLDELASRYHGGAASFWEDWLEFTETATPTLVLRQPQLMLVARSFEPKTAQALEFLLENKLPVKLLKVAFYADEDGHRFLNVEWENEPETALSSGTQASIPTTASGTATDFLEVTLGEVAQVVGAPKDLVWVRPGRASDTTRSFSRMGISSFPTARHSGPLLAQRGQQLRWSRTTGGTPGGWGRPVRRSTTSGYRSRALLIWRTSRHRRRRTTGKISIRRPGWTNPLRSAVRWTTASRGPSESEKLLGSPRGFEPQNLEAEVRVLSKADCVAVRL